MRLKHLNFRITVDCYDLTKLLSHSIILDLFRCKRVRGFQGCCETCLPRERDPAWRQEEPA